MKIGKIAILAIASQATVLFGAAAYCFFGGQEPSKNMGSYRSFSFYADQPGNAALSWMQPGNAPADPSDEFWFDSNGNFNVPGGVNISSSEGYDAQLTLDSYDAGNAHSPYLNLFRRNYAGNQEYGWSISTGNANSGNDGNLYFRAATTGAFGPPVFTIDPGGDVVIRGASQIGADLKTFSVNGVTRAVEYLSSGGKIDKIVVLHDSSVTDYGNDSTTGSIAWAMNAVQPGGEVKIMGGENYPLATGLVINKPIRLVGSMNGDPGGGAISANAGAVLDYTGSRVGLDIYALANWRASTAVRLGTVIVPVGSATLYEACTTAGTTAATPPTWPTTAGGTVTDGSVVWTAFSLSSWASSTVESSGTIISGQSSNGYTYYYQCTTAGTTGSIAPAWATTIGETTTDGTAVWTAISQGSDISGTEVEGITLRNNGSGTIGLYLEAPGHNFVFTNVNVDAYDGPYKWSVADYVWGSQAYNDVSVYHVLLDHCISWFPGTGMIFNASQFFNIVNTRVEGATINDAILGTSSGGGVSVIDFNGGSYNVDTPTTIPIFMINNAEGIYWSGVYTETWGGPIIATSQATTVEARGLVWEGGRVHCNTTAGTIVDNEVSNTLELDMTGLVVVGRSKTATTYLFRSPIGPPILADFKDIMGISGDSLFQYTYSGDYLTNVHIYPCSGTATLSSGAATVSNSCITGAAPVVCTDQTGANAVKCAPSAGSLAITGAGSDVISWAQQ